MWRFRRRQGGLGVNSGRGRPGWGKKEAAPPWAGLLGIAFLGGGDLGLNFDEHAGGDDEAVEGFDRARGGFEDVDDAFVGADFELFPALLVDVGRAEDGELFDAGGEGDGPADLGAGAFGVVDDFLGGRVEGAVIVGFHADTDAFVGASGHGRVLSRKVVAAGEGRGGAGVHLDAPPGGLKPRGTPVRESVVAALRADTMPGPGVRRSESVQRGGARCQCRGVWGYVRGGALT